jgi:glycyl-tRNA synthetase
MALKMEISSRCANGGVSCFNRRKLWWVRLVLGLRPLGVELKRNVKDAWWQSVVRERDDMVGLDSSILMHPKIWGSFGARRDLFRPARGLQKCNSRFRADHIDVSAACPNCGETVRFTEPRNFNLMFKTSVGPVDKEDGSNIAYLRPETAQGIFVNFVNAQTPVAKSCPLASRRSAKRFATRSRLATSPFRTANSSKWKSSISVAPKTLRVCIRNGFRPATMVFVAGYEERESEPAPAR